GAAAAGPFPGGMVQGLQRQLENLLRFRLRRADDRTDAAWSGGLSCRGTGGMGCGSRARDQSASGERLPEPPVSGRLGIERLRRGVKQTAHVIFSTGLLGALAWVTD